MVATAPDEAGQRVDEAIDALSGTFSVESSPGAGTRIIVRVPKSVRGATP
jgi:signal transduction histidine kinase